MINFKNFLLMVLSLIAIYLIGTLGYIYIEHYSLMDAIYMTAITISTVGFSELRPLSPYGKIFTIFLIFIGISFVLYSLSVIVKFILEGELNKYLKGVKVKNKINNLSNHIIICGAGRTGYRIIEQYVKTNEDFVVIESDIEKIKVLESTFGNNILILNEDATKDETLIEAGISRAKALVAVLSSDAENLFLSLSAKSLNNKISVITRALDLHSEAKLKKAGADYVISPLSIAADKIVKITAQDNINKFIDYITESGVDDLKIEFIDIPENSKLANKTLLDAKIPQKTSLIVVGIEENGKIKLNPTSTSVINPNSKLLVFGKQEQIKKLQNLIRG